MRQTINYTVGTTAGGEWPDLAEGSIIFDSYERYIHVLEDKWVIVKCKTYEEFEFWRYHPYLIKFIEEFTQDSVDTEMFCPKYQEDERKGDLFAKQYLYCDVDVREEHAKIRDTCDCYICAGCRGEKFMQITAGSILVDNENKTISIVRTDNCKTTDIRAESDELFELLQTNEYLYRFRQLLLGKIDTRRELLFLYEQVKQLEGEITKIMGSLSEIFPNVVVPATPEKM